MLLTSPWEGRREVRNVWWALIKDQGEDCYLQIDIPLGGEKGGQDDWWALISTIFIPSNYYNMAYLAQSNEAEYNIHNPGEV